MRQHRLAEQALEQAHDVRMQLERMGLLGAIEPPQHIDERRLRIDAGLGRIGDRGVQSVPALSHPAAAIASRNFARTRSTAARGSRPLMNKYP